METWVQDCICLLHFTLVTTTHTHTHTHIIYPPPPPPSPFATGNKEAADSSDEHTSTITHVHHEEGSQPLQARNPHPKRLSLPISSRRHDNMTNEIVHTQSTQSMTPESVTRPGYSNETPVESARPAPPAGGGHGSRYPHTG